MAFNFRAYFNRLTFNRITSYLRGIIPIPCKKYGGFGISKFGISKFGISSEKSQVNVLFTCALNKALNFTNLIYKELSLGCEIYKGVVIGCTIAKDVDIENTLSKQLCLDCTLRVL